MQPTNPSGPSSEAEHDRARRRFLRAGGVAATIGLAGCAGLGGITDDETDRSRPKISDEFQSRYVPHPNDDVSMFRRGLRRLGYFPDEVVPDSVTVDWEFPLNEAGHTAAKSSPVPTPDGETIVFAGDTGRVVGMTPDGEQRWETQTDATDKGFHGSAAIVDDVVYIGGYDGALYAMNVDDGELRWKTEASELDGALAVGSSPAYYDGTLYFISEFADPFSGALWAIDPETGEPIWQDDRIWGRAHPSPSIDLQRGRILAGSNDGAVYCWEFPSLEFAWKFQLEANGASQVDGTFNLGSEIKGSAPLYDGHAYFGSFNGCFYCVDIMDGSEVWSFETDRAIMSNAAVDPDAGVVYMGSDDGYVYALDPETGDQYWSANVNGRVVGALTVTAETVLAGSYDSYLYALDKKTGDRRWRVENRGRVTTSPVPVDGRIYYAERGVFSNYYDDKPTVFEEPGHAYCLVGDE
ncbi:outer membrane protein assembly factor BamB family protein [Halopiger djelfimassiliensis]|uniref:outer membrane protein assembly factor BamB family protein n=1 Tax=Halopiger djelfimassiliensis TaxID=1293047 RepID=UPI0006782EA0|nr:PQQ-binding-like beta-propeller repeat protein [Halopiger djelfimassiliensis]